MRLSFAYGLFWLSVACCAIAQFYIIRSVRGSRHVPEPTANVPHSRGGVEMVWAVLPAIGLVLVLVFTWRAVRATNGTAPVRAQSAMAAT